MPRAVILTSHPDDYQAIRVHLTHLAEETHSQGTVYELGQFSTNGQTWEVAIAEIDNSNTSAASEAERAISHFKPDVIFLVSGATGIKDVSLGDVVVATKVYGYELGRAENKFLPRPETQKPSYPLESRAKAERRHPHWRNRLSPEISNSSPSVLLAPIASGEKEVADEQADLLKFLRSQYSDAVAVENLGFGFLKAVDANQNVLALTVHGICRLINDNPDLGIQADSRSIGSQNAIAFTFEILAKYKTDNAETTERVQGVVSYGITPDDLLAGIGKRIKEAVNGGSSSLMDERHKRIDYAQTLIQQGQFNQAVQYLEMLNADLWYQLDDILKYRLLTNLGMAKLGLDESSDAAAAKFVEAQQYNPQDDAALALAAMGYVFQKDYPNAEKFIETALQKNPANALAYSLRVRIASVTESIESVLEQIPPAYHECTDVLVALGEAALKRGLYEKAEEWWQAALNNNNGNSMDSVKAFLAVALMEPIIQNYPLIAAGQLLDSQKHSLERAVSLFTEVLGGAYVNPNDLSPLKFTALVNRAGTLRLLGHYDEAIRDIEIALRKKPKEPYLIKQRALLAHEKGNEEEAYNYVQQILFSPETPEASLLAASSLMALKRVKEAEDILNQFLQTDSPEYLKQEAKRLKFDLFLERDDRKNAEDILQQVNNEDPESVFTLIQNIRWQKYIGSEENIPALVEQAKAALFSKSSTHAQIILADVLYSLSYYRDAAEVYEHFVDKTLNTALSRQLVQAHYFAGNYRDALNLCQQLLDKYGVLPTLSEIAASIYSDIGNMDATRQICENYLNIFPDNVVVQLLLASVHYATGKYEELDRFLDSRPSIKTLKLANIKKLAQFYKVRDRIDSFFEVIYEMRHCFYNDGQVHAFYQISYLEATKIQSGIQNFETVKDGCGVLLRNIFGKDQWYILEDRPDVNLTQYELNSSQSLYQYLIGKHIGEEVVLVEDNFGRNTLRILAITDKYCAAGKQSFSVLENQTNIKGFRIVPVPMEGDSPSSNWVQQFIEGLKQHQEDFNLIKSEYVSGKLPFGAVAILVNRNPIELWQILAFGSSPFIHAWSNYQQEKFEDALITLQKGGLIVIDPISLVTLHHLGVADDVVRLLGKFGIAQSTIDLFQAKLDTAQGLQGEGFTTFGVEDGQGIKQEVTSEQIAREKTFFGQVINWVRENCFVLPCQRKLDINHDERTKLYESIDAVFIDTMLIAGEPGRILYSDDQWLRWYAGADSSVPGVWTQVVLRYCLIQQNINESLYRKATLGLANLGYRYTIIDAKTLMEAVRLTEWKLQPIYASALKALADKNTPLEYAVSVAADFLRQLYLDVVITHTQLIDPRDALVFEMLKILTEKRSATIFVKELERAIQERFHVIPLQQQEVQRVINAWFNSQSFIT
ncbi:PIN domain-containing protein [Microcoleus sp. K5-D4]|uniref:PIN domain-containing protein n=1 Tax=Microcoleus sp. K5-D4 TaxID=2818801 RepID=UPI002FCE7764